MPTNAKLTNPKHEEPNGTRGGCNYSRASHSLLLKGVSIVLFSRGLVRGTSIILGHIATHVSYY